MIAFLEKLTRRKIEVARKTGGEWQALVIAVADGNEIDPDETLAALDRLGKSTDDLAKGVELLNQRRAWSVLVAAGTAAEVEHPKIKKTIDAEVALFAALEEKHEQRLWPLQQSQTAAAFSMSEAAEAKRELLRTASDPLRLQAVSDAETKLTELRRERQEHDHRLSDKADALRQYQTRGQALDSDTIERLEIEVASLQVESKAFDERAAKLNGECETARAMLLTPEAI